MVITPKNWIGYEKTQGITGASLVMTQLLTCACPIQKFRILSRYSNMLNNEVRRTKHVILKLNTLFSEIDFVIWLHNAYNLVTSDPRSANARHNCGMTIMMMLLSKFRLLSRYYSNMLNNEVLLTNHVILKLNTLFSEIDFVIWLHNAYNLVTSDPGSANARHNCGMTNMMMLL